VFQERVHHIEEQLSDILGHSGPSYDPCPSLWNALSTRNPPGLAAPDHTVPTGRFFSGTLPRHFVPGYDRCCPYGTKYVLRAEALIKLAFMRVNPGLKPRPE
jgi:hypothetical protein